MNLSISADLKDQVAVVTGASQGLGKAVAIALGINGAKVVCLARNAEKLAATVKEIEADWRQCRGGCLRYHRSDGSGSGNQCGQRQTRSSGYFS